MSRAPSRTRRSVAGAVLAVALLAATGCASAVDPLERLGRKAAERVGPAQTRDATTVAEQGAAGVRDSNSRAEP
ncbi:hypothetical protein [Streptomyces sp. NPDC058671]|uniref:hypothetical protein n=1 Tax=Streptomyces sp. NPDC058671 TaxID=3346590 RepID=UPI00365C771D